LLVWQTKAPEEHHYRDVCCPLQNIDFYIYRVGYADENNPFGKTHFLILREIDFANNCLCECYLKRRQCV